MTPAPTYSLPATNLHEPGAKAGAQDSQQLQHAVLELNHYLLGRRRDLQFKLGHAQGQPQVLIVDAVSGTVLREMAVAEALRTARYLEHDRCGLVRQRT